MSKITVIVSAIFTLLIMVSVAIGLLQWKKPKLRLSEWRLRIKTWWWIIITLALAFWLKAPGLMLLMMIASFIAVVEFIHFFKPKLTRGQLAIMMLSVPLQFIFAYFKVFPWFYAFIPTVCFFLIAIQTLFSQKAKCVFSQTAEVFWGEIFLVYFLSHTVALLGFYAHQGVLMLLCVILVTTLSDTAQYAVGKIWGKHPIIKHISPNKTWQGFIAGMIAAMVLTALLGPYLLGYSWVFSALIGLALGIAGFLGDITFSAFKRAKGLQDFGTCLPGHGGIIDRIDSLCFTAPLFFYIIHWFR